MNRHVFNVKQRFGDFKCSVDITTSYSIEKEDSSWKN